MASLPEAIVPTLLDSLAEPACLAVADGHTGAQILARNAAWRSQVGGADAGAPFLDPAQGGCAPEALGAGGPCHWAPPAGEAGIERSCTLTQLGTEGGRSYVLARLVAPTDARAPRDRIQQLEALTRLQREVATTGLDLATRRQRVADVAMAVTGAEAAVVEEVEGAEMVYRAVAGKARGHEGTRLSIEGSITGYCYQRGAPLVVGDVECEDRPIALEAARRVGFISGILVPLSHAGASYGVLKVYSGQPDCFGAAERYLLELASSVLAAGLADAWRYDRAEARRGALLDALPALIAYIDRDWRFQEVNAAYETYYGLPAERIRGRPVAEVMAAEDFERLRPHIDGALAGRHVVDELTLVDAEGGTRTLRPEFFPHTESGGWVAGAYAVIHDITDRIEARHDFVTGLNNRRAFEREGARLLAHAQRYNRPLCVLMLDIDHFKAVNDRLGHATGDTVLRRLASLIEQVTRASDLPARWGGEEFVVLLPEAELHKAVQVAERLRRGLEAERFAWAGTVTASFGVAAADASEGLDSLLARADARLYAAKAAGRNRVVATAEAVA